MFKLIGVSVFIGILVIVSLLILWGAKQFIHIVWKQLHIVDKWIYSMGFVIVLMGIVLTW